MSQPRDDGRLPGVFAALGRGAARRRWWVVAGTAVVVLVGVLWGTGVFGNVIGGSGFETEDMEAVRTERVLQGPLGRHAADIVVLYESDRLAAGDPAFAGPVRRALDALPRERAERVESYWSTGDRDFLSRDGRAAYALVQLPSGVDQDRVRQYEEIRGALAAPAAEVPGMKVSFGGSTPMTHQVNALAVQDLVRAEVLSLPVVLILLMVIFRTVVAGALPLLVGLVVLPGALAILRVVSTYAEISTYAFNVVSILALGLAIDYGLLMVTRFREELAAGRDVDAAVERTMATAGRTVAFSGLTVGASFACLLVFPSRFLISMAWGGIATVVVAVAASLVLLPAMLRFAGRRVNALRVPFLPPPRVAAADRGRWYRLARGVIRRPLATTLAVVAVLLALGAPFLSVNWARPGDWVLPPDAEARHVTQQMAARFAHDPSRTVTAVVTASGPIARAELDAYAGRLAGVPGVHEAEVTGVRGNQARLSVGYTPDPMSPQAYTMVERLRATPPPPGAQAGFAGMAASRVDVVEMILGRLPLMALAVAVVSFVVLFLAFGSVVIPVKALLLNLLSLTAAFGAIKLVFQDGWLSGLLGFVPAGAVDINYPVLVVGIALGLAMDYEVFLLARVREEWERTGDPAEAVAVGLQRTGPTITGAALLMAVVVAGFLTADMVLMLMIGVGLTIAVVVDATIVRALLLPAAMGLLGRAAWWSPAPLARWWRRYGAAVAEGPYDGQRGENPGQRVPLGA
ncbi:RND superfamily putative drug exporter [Thermocatellispora tengchongensis]|uniref:RND superfamily putative drug exporter n=1 Tax=Thermocatellispora tengchongensis TaxID=1073253 RepID=A0A840PD26_9ACTN|nr:MMPL family transporter [Thermocatellispora tengchongensis]MBB5135067.1 RND superfamily putative drug exporter [Thermocatellispora tengchongensis]